MFHSLLKLHPFLTSYHPCCWNQFLPQFLWPPIFLPLPLSWLSFHKLHTFPMSDLLTALKWNRWSSRKSCTINTTCKMNGLQECLQFCQFHYIHIQDFTYRNSWVIMKTGIKGRCLIFNCVISKNFHIVVLFSFFHFKTSSLYITALIWTSALLNSRRVTVVFLCGYHEFLNTHGVIIQILLFFS